MITFILLFIPILVWGVPYPPTREPIDPYINGDTFRNYCDFAFDELTSFDPSLVKNGNTVFINGDYLEQFANTIHPHISSQYILVCHNTDHAIPGSSRHILDDEKLLALFTQNQDGTVHPKLHPLPIGVENRRWNNQNVEILAQYKQKNVSKTYLAYCNINPWTFPSERKSVLDQFSHAPFCYCSERKPFDSFAFDVVSSKFVICPRGNGLDTHRFWETLYAGSFPVIKSSSLDPLFEHLPVVIVKEWSDVTEEFLHAKYEELMNGSFVMEKLYSEYYFKKIESIKQASRP